jgi:hypothetical protein
MDMKGRHRLDLGVDRVRRAGLVVVPVDMHGAAVAVRVGAAGEDRDAASQRGVKRIAARVVIVVMRVIVSVRPAGMFHEPGLVGVIVGAVAERQHDVEAVRLGYLVEPLRIFGMGVVGRPALPRATTTCGRRLRTRMVRRRFDETPAGSQQMFNG